MPLAAHSARLGSLPESVSSTPGGATRVVLCLRHLVQSRVGLQQSHFLSRHSLLLRHVLSLHVYQLEFAQPARAPSTGGASLRTLVGSRLPGVAPCMLQGTAVVADITAALGIAGTVSVVVPSSACSDDSRPSTQETRYRPSADGVWPSRLLLSFF